MSSFSQALARMPSGTRTLFFVLGGAIFLMSIVLHELMHGVTAYRLGDETAHGGVIVAGSGTVMIGG